MPSLGSKKKLTPDGLEAVFLLPKEGITTMKNFRTLTLAIQFNREVRRLSIRGSMKDQLLRAAQSIALNLAEGRGKETPKDQKKFFVIAFGSIRECQAILMIEELENSAIWKLLDSIGAHAFKLIRSI